MNQNSVDVFKYYELPFETYFAKEIHHKNQIHDEIELVWLVRGSAKIVCDNVNYTLNSQNLFMININQIHSIETTSDSLLIAYRFKKEHLIKNNLSFDQFRFINRVYTFQELVVKYHEVPLLIAQLLKLLISTKSNNVVRYKIIGYYNMFVYELYTMLLKERYLDIKKKNYDNYLIRLNTIIEYINNNFKRKISLDEIASAVGLSRFRLSHFIKDYIGISFQDYILNTRLEYALKQLKETKNKVTEISKEAGFSDIKYLNGAMKKRLGITALKYRKIVANPTVIQDENTTNTFEFTKELQICLRRIEETKTFHISLE